MLAKLQKNKQLLETMQHEDSTIWEQKLKEVKKLKVNAGDWSCDKKIQIYNMLKWFLIGLS